MGIPKDHILILSSGNVLELKDEQAKIIGQVPHGGIMVDGLGVGDVGNIVLRDRQMLSQNGLLIVVLTLSRYDNRLLAGPDIVSRGFVYVRENEDLIDEARIVVENTLEKCMKKNMRDWNAIKQAVRDDLRGFIYRKTERSPVILPIFLEV